MEGSTMDMVIEIERLRRCCDARAPNWQALPVEGATLVSCYIESCGKRGTMVLLTRQFPPLRIPLEHHVVFGSLDGVEQRFLALDDRDIGIIIDPSKGEDVRLVEARVDFWPTNEDPTTCFAAPTSGEEWELRAAFNVTLRFGATGA
jgi:hypothetical protein